MEPETHDEGGGHEPGIGREDARNAETDSEEKYRQSRKAVLLDNQHEEHGQECEEPGDLPDRLNNANLVPCKTDLFNGEIVEQRGPCLQPYGRADGQYHQKAVHGFLCVLNVHLKGPV